MTSTATHPQLLRGTNLYLVGMMGAGKSTLGKYLATRLDYRFLDTDSLIEHSAGQTIPDLFRHGGEAEFRALETQVLEQVATFPRLVVATGGGIVLNAQNWGIMRSSGIIVWLDAPLSEIQHRLAQDPTPRPLLQRPDWPQHLATLMAQRRDRYAEADLRLVIHPGEPTDDIAQRLLAQLEENVRPIPTIPSDIND